MNIEDTIRDIEDCVKPIVGGKSLELALEVLKKQIPITPIAGYYSEGDYLWECVVCDNYVEDGQIFCHVCGQKLI